VARALACFTTASASIRRASVAISRASVIVLRSSAAASLPSSAAIWPATAVAWSASCWLIRSSFELASFAFARVASSSPDARSTSACNFATWERRSSRSCPVAWSSERISSRLRLRLDNSVLASFAFARVASSSLPVP